MSGLTNLRNLLFNPTAAWMRSTGTSHRRGADRSVGVGRTALVEMLEDRTLLTNFVVNAATDDAADLAGAADGMISLREAIIAANTNAVFGDAPAGAADGDTITFDPAVFGPGLIQTITIGNGEFGITDDLSINGGGLGLTIDAANASRIFNVNTAETVNLSSLNLTNGNSAGGNGGAIQLAGGGTTNLTSLNISTSTAGTGFGGGVNVNNSTANLTNVNLTGNTASDGGGLNNDGGTVTINGGTISGNTATGGGSGIGSGGGVGNFLTGSLTISGATIMGNDAQGNSANQGGGGVYSFDGTVNITGGSISGNMASGTSGSGGGVFSDRASMILSGTTISGNMANRAGGGIEVITGSLSLSSVTLGGTMPVDGNIAGPVGTANPGNGGGLHVSGAATVTIDAGRVENNKAASEGGGLWNQAGAVMIVTNGTVIKDNLASGDSADDGGGGIFNNGGRLALTLGVNVRDNVANGTAGSGGGIFSTGGVVTIDAASISGNKANRAGGGIEVVTGTVVITESSLGGVNPDEGNIAGPLGSANPGNGGGLHVTGLARVTLNNSQVLNNVAALEGGGLWNSSTGTMIINNGTMVSENRASGAAAHDGGGGIFNNGGRLAIVNGVTIQNNRADGALGSGGGILSLNGAVTVESSAIRGNVANRAGGGIEVVEGTVLLTGSTLGGPLMAHGNIAGPSGSAAPGNGGGLHVSGGADVTIKGGSVSNNVAAREGGGLWNSGPGARMVIRDGVEISHNTASGDASDDGGGGIFNNGGRLAIQDGVSIRNNNANGGSGSGGGIFSINGGVTIDNATISGNMANRAGGGIELVEGIAILTNTTLGGGTVMSGNVAGPLGTANPGNGGGLHVTGLARTIVDGGLIANNHAAREGGGLWNSGPGAVMIVRNGTRIQSNQASGAAADDGGGGIFNNGGRLNVLNGVVIDGNVADGTSGSGGGIFSINGAVTVSDSTISANMANRAGGGIEVVDGHVGLKNVILGGTFGAAGNVAGPFGSANPGNGGGLHVTGSARTNIEGGRVQNNKAALEGGGLWNQGGAIMTLDSVMVTGNIASGPQTHDGGGGIFNNGGRLDVRNSTINHNAADNASGSGGGIFDLAGVTTITNSTLSGNTATGIGGGIDNQGELYMANVTVTGNIADTDDIGLSFGGGLSNTGIARLRNTIVAGNMAGMAAPIPSDIGGAVTASAYNLIGDAGTAGGLVNAVNGNIVGVMGVGTRPINEILITVLGDNGGPTATHALVPGSLAINRGNNALARDVNGITLVNDQRGTGFPRIFDDPDPAIIDRVDIGAVEFTS
ncbi:MAG: hypothetical protein KDA86_14450 [Planctomycetaceae bacterium]|nr:hypothetical protein [Planctomycetaceae bacterium]